MKEKFSIQFVAKVTGLDPHLLRAWEKRYGLIKPDRLDNGRRAYNDEQITYLKKISSLIKRGHGISDLVGMSLEELTRLEVNGTEESVYAAKRNRSPFDYNSCLQRLILASHHYKLDVISHELEKIKGEVDVREFALNLLAPLMVEVGNQVENGQLNIAQEHALSALVRFHVGQILHQNYQAKGHSPYGSFLIATPEEELHEFGVIIAALLCCYYNLHFYYFGPSLPMDAVVEACKRIEPRFIVLGISKSYLELNTEDTLEKYVKHTVDHLPPKSQLIVGGVSKLRIKIKSPKLTFIPTIQLFDHFLSQLVKSQPK